MANFNTIKNHKDIRLYKDDLPENVTFKSVAIDTEAMGLNHRRDRLCLVQLCAGDGVCHLVKIAQRPAPAPRLCKILADRSIEKIFHFARFDIASLYCGLGQLCVPPIYCTKIASRLTRTYTDHHGLRALCRELLGTDIPKFEQCSDWGAEELSESQRSYAASDVLYLHTLKSRLDHMLKRESRYELFRATCDFLPTRVLLDLEGFEQDIFSHGY